MIIDQYTPILFNISEEYSADNIIVTVEWAKLEGVAYNATVSPLASVMFNGSTSVQLVLQYNTEFNLSVVAVIPCGTNVAAVITLNYGEAKIIIIIMYA